MYKFYVMKNDWSPLEIAEVNEDDNTVKMNKTPNSVVNKLNENIVSYLKEDDKHSIGQTINFKIFKSGDVKSYYYHNIKWRRCTAFLFLQISKLGIRHICYFSDKVNHHGQSFGTSMNHVKDHEVKNVIINMLKNDNNTKNVLENVFNISFDDSFDMETLNLSFGI